MPQKILGTLERPTMWYADQTFDSYPLLAIANFPLHLTTYYQWRNPMLLEGRTKE
jgi:hypothetical protein